METLETAANKIDKMFLLKAVASPKTKCLGETVYIYLKPINFLAEVLLIYLVASQKPTWQTKEELRVSRLLDTKTVHHVNSTRARVPLA